MASGRIGEGLHRLAVPADRGGHVGLGPALLRQRVVVARQLGQVGLDQRLRLLPAAGVGGAEGAAHAVAADEVLLGLQRQRGKAGALLDRDHTRQQHRRLRVQRAACGKGGQRVGGVLHALLLQVQLGQLAVDLGFVTLACRAVDQRRDAGRALQVLQREADDAEAVFQQLAVGAAERGDGTRLGGAELAVQHRKERLQRIVQLGLLEARPALHVQRSFVEQALRLRLQHHGKGLLRIGVAAGREQQLAAAELRFGQHRRAGVLGHQPVQRGQRGGGLGVQVLRAGQLVQHTVQAGGLRVLLQEVLVALDGHTQVGRLAGFGTGGVGAVHLQVGQAAFGFHTFRRARAQRRAGEEGLPGRDGLRRRHGGARRGGHRGLACLQAGQRGFVVGHGGGAAAAAGERCSHGQREQGGFSAPHRGCPVWPRWRGPATAPAQNAPASCTRPAGPVVRAAPARPGPAPRPVVPGAAPPPAV